MSTAARTRDGGLAALVAAPAALPTLGLIWAVVLAVATQIPQLHSAVWQADGLSRGDLLAVHALGLDRPLASLAVCLIAGVTLFVVVGRWVRRGIDAMGAGLAVGFGLVALGAWQVSAAAAPVWLDVAAEAPLGPVPTWTADGGGLGPAPGPWRAACRSAPGAQPAARWACQIHGGGLQHDVALARGEPARDQGMQLTWLASATAPTAPAAQLQWLAPDTDRRLTLALGAAQTREAPALGMRFLTESAPETGPLVLVTGDGERPGLRVLASPDLLPQGQARAEVTSAPLLRVQLAEARSPWPLAVGWLLLAGLGAAPLWRWRAGSRQTFGA